MTGLSMSLPVLALGVASLVPLVRFPLATLALTGTGTASTR